MNTTNQPKQHILTIALEDYFQVGAFNRVIQCGQWYRFETRLERNADRALALLDRFRVKATFFVLGWIADRYPELVRKVAEQGHEIASKGYYHRSIREMTPDEFKDDCQRTREALEYASGQKVVGYRVAHEWFHEEDLWALDSLADLGFLYDSSIAPIRNRFRREPFRRFLHRYQTNGKCIYELPISTGKFLGFQLPMGGNYLRQLPAMITRRAIRQWHVSSSSPLVMYFHAWELDPEQPRLAAGSRFTHLRHYRNLHKMEQYLEYLMSQYSFTSAAQYLGLNTTLDHTNSRSVERKPKLFSGENPECDGKDVSGKRTPISIVIPCYNEELILPYLANTLRSVERKLSGKHQVTFLLVDDGSKDNTWEGFQQTFGSMPGFELYRHEANQGVTAAILTGIRRAKTEIVCSMDCDCTYDPHELGKMIPLLQPGVDLVTASPYHPQGHVRNVPGWRLKLSKGASWLYRRVCKQKLHTYTSCFRIYRRSAILKLDIHNQNFLGIAEMVGKLDLQGSQIVEYPATLEVRMLGRSKMKTVRTIFGHLRLMSRLLFLRLFGSKTTSFPTVAPPPGLETIQLTSESSTPKGSAALSS